MQKGVTKYKKWVQKGVTICKKWVQKGVTRVIIYLGGYLMKRKIYQNLLEWKEKKEFKPLLVLGVRQCGKTYIIDEFCKNEFKHYKKINLFKDTEVVELYQSNKNSEKKYNDLKLLIDFDFDKEDSVLFIDEIQQSEELISELKYFRENHSNVRIVCAGSLLGVKLARLTKPFPVGQVTRLYLYPMDFEEFLIAFNQELLIDKIKECFEGNSSMGVIHEKALDYYKKYLLSGGMPESVKNLKECMNDYYNFDLTKLDDIIEDYKNDMNNHVISPFETLKISKIYDSLPSQLQNASKKFQYSTIDSTAKSREYSLPLNWLEASNMVQICKCVKLPEKPLLGFVDQETFKVYYSDVGIFNRLVGNDIKTIMLDDMKIYKGIITENYVANQLKSNGVELLYWKSSRNAEVDFLINTTNEGIIPIEVKAADNTQSKSLKMYNELYNPKYMIRISTKDFGYNPDTKIKSIPLYATFFIKDLVDEQ